MELFFLIAIWGVLCWAIAHKAESRGRSSVGFFLLSFITSPLLGIIILLVMKDVKAEEMKEKAKLEALAEQERLRREEHEKQLEALRALSGAVNPKPSTSGSPDPGASIADEIAKLAQLVDRGLLTTEEFSAQKAALLKSRT